MTTDYRVSATSSANERFGLSQFMFVLLIPALLAIIIFGHVSVAAAPIKHMVAATAIFGILSIYLIVSGAMREFEALTKDTSEAEAACMFLKRTRSSLGLGTKSTPLSPPACH
jgi:hypothetical protein